MNLRPIHDRVILQPERSSETTTGGIILSEGAREVPSRATVVAAGPGYTGDAGEWIPTTVKPGDAVVYNRHSGTDITIDGVGYLVVRERDLYAVLGREEVAIPSAGHPYQEAHASVR